MRSAGRSLMCTAALLACSACFPVHAQNPSRSCPKAADVTWEHLLGSWRAQIAGATDVTLVLQRHPEYRGVRGSISRHGERSDLSGEVGNGEFLLEESTDGVSISATWAGEMVEGSCGREIRGTWRLERDQVERVFLLRKR